MITLKEKSKTFKIIHLEDDRVTQRIIQDMLKINCSNYEIVQHDCGIALGHDLIFENPDILLVDWNLRDCVASEILMTLVRFKGEVIFFSSELVNLIEECIIEFCGKIPHNFHIITKSEKDSYRKLISMIKSYSRRIGKDA